MPIPNVAINVATPYGFLGARGVQRVLTGLDDIHRTRVSAALLTGGGGTLDAGVGLSLFGGAVGSSADYMYALNWLDDAFIAFMAVPANAQALHVLDNGNVS